MDWINDRTQNTVLSAYVILFVSFLILCLIILAFHSHNLEIFQCLLSCSKLGWWQWSGCIQLYVCRQMRLWTFYLILGSVFRFLQDQHVTLRLCCFRFHPNLVLGGTYSGQIVLWDNRVQKRTPVQRTPLSTAAHTVNCFISSILLRLILTVAKSKELIYQTGSDVSCTCCCIISCLNLVAFGHVALLSVTVYMSLCTIACVLYFHVTFGIPGVVNIKVTVMPGCVMDCCQHFEWTSCLSLQGRRVLVKTVGLCRHVLGSTSDRNTPASFHILFSLNDP